MSGLNALILDYAHVVFSTHSLHAVQHPNIALTRCRLPHPFLHLLLSVLPLSVA